MRVLIFQRLPGWCLLGNLVKYIGRKGATGLVELINRVKELWNNNRVQLEENASQIVEVLVQAEETFSKRGSLSDDTLSSACA